MRFIVFLAGFCGLLMVNQYAFAQNAPDTTTGEPTTSDIDPNAGEESETTDDAVSNALGTGASRRNRAVPANGPIASEEWAKADFYGFIDPRQRLDLPDQDLLKRGLRLLTTADFPPFNSRSQEGAPQGYHVELARALCEELSTPCTLKIAPFSKIPEMIANGEADAAIAGLGNHPSLQETLGFSNVYLQRPARFARLKETFHRIDVKGLSGQPVAVRGGTAHEAYLKVYFPTANRVPVTDLEDARQLLLDKKVIAIFGDAFQLLPMTTRADSQLVFAGKPFYDSYFFGDGMAIAYAQNQTGLRRLINFGLLKLAQKGRMPELYARHFALDLYATY